MWRKNKADGPVIPQKILARVRRLQTSDLVDWSDQALYTTGRMVTAYQRDRNPEYLREALTGAQVSLAIMEEMTRRESA